MLEIEQEIVGAKPSGKMIRIILPFFNESIVFPVKEINYIPKYRWLEKTMKLNTWQSVELEKAINMTYINEILNENIIN